METDGAKRANSWCRSKQINTCSELDRLRLGQGYNENQELILS